jgi:hypothetical protein
MQLIDSGARKFYALTQTLSHNHLFSIKKFQQGGGEGYPCSYKDKVVFDADKALAHLVSADKYS